MSRGRAASGGVRGAMDRRLEGGTFSPQDPLQHLSQGIRMRSAHGGPPPVPRPLALFFVAGYLLPEGLAINPGEGAD